MGSTTTSSASPTTTRARSGSRRGSGVDPDDVETNFVAIADPDGHGIARAAAAGVALGDLRPGWLRAVTHLDVTDDDVDAAVDALGAAVSAR